MALYRRRVPVLEEVAGQVYFEVGRPEQADNVLKAAVLVHWSAEPTVTLSFRRLVCEVAENGYLPVIVSACEHEDRLDWHGDLPNGSLVLRKPNIGYDFGSWSVGLSHVPGVASAKSVLLANDSMVGPFTSLAPLLENLETSGADVWAATDTYQYFHHLQSFVLGFQGGVLNDAPLRRFWNTVAQERTKWDIIRNNELGLSRLLLREGYVLRSAFRSTDYVEPGQNPVIIGWSKLLRAGFPFVKREIVRDPSVAPDAERLAQVLHTLHGVRLEEWL